MHDHSGCALWIALYIGEFLALWYLAYVDGNIVTDCQKNPNKSAGEG